jgi:hypothetical protein
MKPLQTLAFRKIALSIFAEKMQKDTKTRPKQGVTECARL